MHWFLCVGWWISVGEPTPPDGAPVATDLYVAKCASCHSVGQGDRVGPDLKGATERRDPAWLRAMIAAPSRVLDTDPAARALLAKYNNVRMPDLGLSDQQVEELVTLLTHCSRRDCDLKGKFRPVTEAVESDVLLGRALFDGDVSAQGGAPACVSCHSAAGSEAPMGGGTLAKDLTFAFGRLGDEGLDAALRNPAFPVMNKVFAAASVTEQEAFALRAFLAQANRSAGAAEAKPLSVPVAGVAVAGGVMVALNAAWGRRLRGVREPLVNNKERRS